LVPYRRNLGQGGGIVRAPLPLSGRILFVDLTGKTTWTEETEPLARRFLGGAGINTQLAFRETPVEASPLSPDNVIALGAGLFVGTPVPAASRLSIVHKNVLTGGYGSSNVGGRFAAELKYAGFDNVVIKGRSDRPVYLLIKDGQASIEDASHLWGRTTWETEADLRERHAAPTVEVLSIGPAGESLVSAANVIVNRVRSASRCGVGAVFGSKNLKGIVASGANGLGVFDSPGFLRLVKNMSKAMALTNARKFMGTIGTMASFPQWNALSGLPVRNFQQTHVPEAEAEPMVREIFGRAEKVRPFSCFACPLSCAKMERFVARDGKVSAGEKLESQNIWDLGLRLGITNLGAIHQLTMLCAQSGLDTSNAGGVLSWAFDCFERGFLTEADTGGLRLAFGDPEAARRLLEKMVRREGIGDLLAKGTREASRLLGKGSERLAMHVKGQDLAEDPRMVKGWGFGLAIAERGGGHTTGSPLVERMGVDPEIIGRVYGTGKTADVAGYAGKARLVYYTQRYHALLDCLGVCLLAGNWGDPELPGLGAWAPVIETATGWGLTADDVMIAGERLVVLQRLFNIRHAGFSRQDDRLPDRFFEEPTTGPRPGERLDRVEYDRMLDEFYDLHQWDRETGQPLPACVKRLGLVDYAVGNAGQPA
jgi:aldehyde:ferredoxin oxidoreductase